MDMDTDEAPHVTVTVLDDEAGNYVDVKANNSCRVTIFDARGATLYEGEISAGAWINVAELRP